MTNLALQQMVTSLGIPMWLIVLLLVWALAWKGIALWKSARLSHKWWFVILLIVNTAGILEIIYIFLIARKYNVETMSEELAEKDLLKPEMQNVSEKIDEQSVEK